MATPKEPHREHPNTYFVQDRSNSDEMTRLQIQDDMLTTGMGGVLPEQTDPKRFQHVLDVGCGTGGWLIEVAKAYPTIPTLVGMDASGLMIEFARKQAKAAGVDDRVEFQVKDATLMIDFPPGYFDLVNQRLGISYLRTWDWPKQLSEYQRVSKPNAVIRITESDIAHGNSPAFQQLTQLLVDTLHRAGHLPAPEMDSFINQLSRLLHQHGIQHVQSKLHILTYPADTPEGKAFYEDMRRGWRTLIPFFRKWTRLPDDYDEIYNRAFQEMQQPDFVGEWKLLTAWGSCPIKDQKLPMTEHH